MRSFLAYGYLIQVVYIVMLVAQSALVPWMIGAEAFGLGVYLLSVMVISEGLVEPIWQLSITNRPAGLGISERTVIRDTLVICALSVAVAVYVSLEHVSAGLALAVALHGVTIFLSVIAQSYLYKSRKTREIALAMVWGLLGYFVAVLAVEGAAKLVVANLAFTTVSLVVNVISLRGFRLPAVEADEKNVVQRARFYLGCVCTRAPFIVLNNGLAFLLGAQGRFEDVALFRIVTSAIYAGRFLSPVSPAIFSSLVEDHRQGAGRHPFRVLGYSAALWTAYGIGLVLVLPHVIGVIYPNLVVGARIWIVLLSPAYLSMQMLFYWLILRGRGRGSDLLAIAISVSGLVAAVTLYMFQGAWIAFAVGCVLTVAMTTFGILQDSRSRAVSTQVRPTDL